MAAAPHPRASNLSRVRLTKLCHLSDSTSNQKVAVPRYPLRCRAVVADERALQEYVKRSARIRSIWNQVCVVSTIKSQYGTLVSSLCVFCSYGNRSIAACLLQNVGSINPGYSIPQPKPRQLTEGKNLMFLLPFMHFPTKIASVQPHHHHKARSYWRNASRFSCRCCSSLQANKVIRPHLAKGVGHLEALIARRAILGIGLDDVSMLNRRVWCPLNC